MSSYTQGYTEATLRTHLRRTAESEASFLLPYITADAKVLDVGCGPGTITTSFLQVAPKAEIIGVDISSAILTKAKSLAEEKSIATEGPGSVQFKVADVLDKLPFDDESFDIIFASQLFGHLPPPELPVHALHEMRRVLKTGGILATRDGVEQHFYPTDVGMDETWVRHQARVLHGKDTPAGTETTGRSMPALMRAAGFDKVRVGAGATVFAGKETREWISDRGLAQLKEGDPVKASWLEVGLSEEEIVQTRHAIEKWRSTEDAWMVGVMCEMLAWK